MTLGQRTTLSFLDLALIMVGVMALLLQLSGQNQHLAAAALNQRFGDQHHRLQSHKLPLNILFEQGDARLSALGKQRLAQLLPTADHGAMLVIAVPLSDREPSMRLSQWELSAARTASLMQYMVANGLDQSQISADLPALNGKSVSKAPKARASGAAQQSGRAQQDAPDGEMVTILIKP